MALLGGGRYNPNTYNSSGTVRTSTTNYYGTRDVSYDTPTISSAGLTSSAVAASTGVNPVEESYSLYGHIVPLSVFGKGRIGGEIISGPWTENGKSSFIISFGFPADPSGTRILKQIAFDSEVIWEGSLSGAGTPSSGGFYTEPVTCRWYDGNMTQGADALETAHFGSNAIAYRPQMLLAFENLPLANTKFGKIPYVAALISDASGEDVNLGEAFERLAYSPFVGYTSSQFETSGITDGLVGGGLIFAEDAEFLSLIQQFGRFYSNWDILQTDKLRIVDRGSNVTADITLDKTRLMGNVTVNRQGQDAIRKDLELSTIDPDADYSIVPFRVQRPRDPVAVTTSVGTDSAYLPVIMESSTRAAIATLARYHDEQTRKSISGTALAFGLEIEPGDLVAITSLGGDFNNEVFKIVETLHGANYAVEFTAQAILNCTIAISDEGEPVSALAWDPASNTDSAHIALSNNNLTATCNGGNGADKGVRSTATRGSGKRYLEFTVGTFGGTGFTNEGIGITIAGQALETDGATNFDFDPSLGGQSFWVRSTGSIVFRGGPTGRTLSGIANSIVSFAIDLDNNRAWVRKDGGTWNAHGGDDPEINVGGIDISDVFDGNPAYVFFMAENGTAAAVTVNFGASAFSYDVPSGYSAWGVAE